VGYSCGRRGVRAYAYTRCQLPPHPFRPVCNRLGGDW
jgi:hypothetical protein